MLTTKLTKMTELVYYDCTCNLNHHQNVHTINNFNQWRTLDLRTVSGITSDRREDKCIRRRYQSLHESIDSVPDDRSTIRHSIYNKHQTCTAVCRQVVHESKSIIIRDIQCACVVQKNSTIAGKYTLVYRTSETKYCSPQWST